MRISFDDLDMTAIIVFAILLASLTSAQMSYKQTSHINPFSYNPALLLATLSILILNLFLSSTTMRIGLLAGYTFAFGIYERVIRIFDPTIYSDVLLVTKEAIHVILAGDNIYLHLFRSSIPPGQPFKYGPFEPIFYIPFYYFFEELRFAELFSCIIIMALVFSLGKFIGYAKTLIPLALYSCWGIIIESTGAGVNDDSAGMLAFLSIFLLILAMRQKSRSLAAVSSIVLGISICFKLFPALFAPFIILFLFNLKNKSPINWKYYMALVATTIFVLSLPYLLVSPKPYLNNIFIENSKRLVAFQLQWHIWNSLLNRSFFLYLPRLFNIDVVDLIPIIPKIMLTISLATIILLLVVARKVTSLALATCYGIIVWFVLLTMGPWFPFSYFAFITPFVCSLPILDLASRNFKRAR